MTIHFKYFTGKIIKRSLYLTSKVLAGGNLSFGEKRKVYIEFLQIQKFAISHKRLVSLIGYTRSNEFEQIAIKLGASMVGYGKTPNAAWLRLITDDQ